MTKQISGAGGVDEKPPINIFVERAKKRKAQERMEHAREVKQARADEKAQARHEAEERALEQEFEDIDEREAQAYKKYDELFEACKTSDDDKLWKKCDDAQRVAMNISTRKRFLYSHFDKATAESAPDIPVVAGIESADPYGVLDEDDDMIAAMLAEEMSGA